MFVLRQWLCQNSLGFHQQKLLLKTLAFQTLLFLVGYEVHFVFTGLFGKSRVQPPLNLVDLAL